MFGTIKPFEKTLSKCDREIYRRYYCGLCKALYNVSGVKGQFLLSNDLTFAYIVLDSLYSRASNIEYCKCIKNCGKKKSCIYTIDIAEYVATMNVVLFYKKLEDDIVDDNSLLAKLLRKLFNKQYLRLKEQNYEFVIAIETLLEEVWHLEKESASCYQLAETFSLMIQKLFIGMEKHAYDKCALMGLGEWIGKWIYAIDAWKDFYDDVKKNKFNPLIIKQGQTCLEEQQIKELNDYLTECQIHTEEYMYILGIHKNREIITNILRENMDFHIGQLQKREEKYDKKRREAKRNFES